MLNICVVGQGTLANTTAECGARHFKVIHNHIWDGEGLDLVWVCYDTPLTPDGADYEWVMGRIREDLKIVPPHVPVLISSQMMVGTITRLEREYPDRAFAYSPENIRVATAQSDFLRQERIVVGYRNPVFDRIVYQLFPPFTQKLIITTPETAEMVKHALNAYLGMNIAFINEIARVAKVVGADMTALESALLSERRVSPDAPLHAGPPFGKGHLARDLHTLEGLSDAYGLFTPLLWSILASNRG
jgi:UDPglucose 6-dehydrogenase